MIDKFALLVTHGLMLLTAWRLLSRPELHETEAEIDEHKLARSECDLHRLKVRVLLVFSTGRSRSMVFWNGQKKGEGGEDIKGVHDETKGRDKGPYVEEFLNGIR